MKKLQYRALFWLPYRVFRRIAIANVNYIYQRPVHDMKNVVTEEECSIEQCSSSRLRGLMQTTDRTLSESDFALLESGKASCYAALHNNSLVGYAWVAFGDVSADMNHDGKPDTGLPIQLGDDTAFIFHVLVLPDYRGRRLYAAIVSQIASELETQGIRTMVLTTEASNHRARRAVKRMGFNKIGQTWIFQVGPLCKVFYSTIPEEFGIKIGRYVGDCVDRKRTISGMTSL
ncbi:GNAT family N-acetyltransferase [Novipirellula rosea]|uniref:N-acetyltransferase domain-containing protein n=1 Tax=Novipirellula rosea TaxID=1031540 RepID=A0ABP8NDG8_9BACT